MKTWLDAFIEAIEDNDMPKLGDVANVAFAVLGWASYFYIVIGVLP